MRVDGGGVAALILTFIMLASSLATFTPDLEMSNTAGEVMDTLENLRSSLESGLTDSLKPRISTVRLKVMFADMGYSRYYEGNETCHSLKPISNALISLSGRFALTNLSGEAILSVPRGNQTLAVSRDGVSWWKTEVDVDREEEFRVTFIPYRLAPLNVTVKVKAFATSQLVSLTFRLPETGEYYVGRTIITYYTAVGEANIYREDFSEAIPLKKLDNVWEGILMGRSEARSIMLVNSITGAVSIIELPSRNRSIILIDYGRVVNGGELVTNFVDVKGQPVYIVPWMSYLPVERVILEKGT